MKNCAAISMLVFLSFAAPCVAFEDAPAFAAPKQNTIANFTQSMVDVYVVSQKCRQFTNMNFAEYSKTISTYLNVFYNNRMPFWVLPDVRDSIKSSDQCIVTMDERVENYQIHSRQFAEEYRDSPKPPALTMVMIKENAPTIPAPATVFNATTQGQSTFTTSLERQSSY